MERMTKILIVIGIIAIIVIGAIAVTDMTMTEEKPKPVPMILEVEVIDFEPGTPNYVTVHLVCNTDCHVGTYYRDTRDGHYLNSIPYVPGTDEYRVNLFMKSYTVKESDLIFAIKS